MTINLLSFTTKEQKMDRPFFLSQKHIFCVAFRLRGGRMPLGKRTDAYEISKLRQKTQKVRADQAPSRASHT